MEEQNLPAVAGPLMRVVRPLIERLREGTFYDVQALMDEAADAIEDLRQVLRMVDDNNRVDAGEDRKAWRGDFVDAEVRRALGA